jgi:DNA-directed RNA polymerase specialized sigma24 family protein
VKLALVENGYAAFRQFEGRCSIATYVASIAHRLLVDEQMHVGGRWRPSAEAKRAGEGAVLLETLVVRDRKPLEEALPLVQKIDAGMTRAAAEALLARLPPRTQRARLVPLDEETREQAVGSETVEELAVAHDRAAAAATTNTIVRDVLATLSTEDRVLLRLRFGEGMRVPAIARAWQCDVQVLYRRIQVLVGRLRRQLVEAGIDAATAAQLIGGDDSTLDFGWTDTEKTESRQTIRIQRDSGSGEALP